MKKIYINAKHAEENRVVIVEDGKLRGFEQEIAGRENKKGDIYKGVVTRVEKSLDAAFVDLGGYKNGFLPLKEVAQNLRGEAGGEADEPPLAEGDSILVQIKKDHTGGKGAGLTTHISLAGCYLVLLPNRGTRANVSKHGDYQTRREMHETLRRISVPDGMGIIVRTAGLGRDAAELQWDLESYLLPLWRTIESAGEKEPGPVLVYGENNLQLRAVRDYFRGDDDQIICDQIDCYQELRDFVSIVFPDRVGNVSHFRGDGGMIPDAVESQIDEIFEREVNTVSGARVVFDSTEAMVAVDVNSAKIRGGDDIEETALQANLEAAETIARQLQLRDLAGLVVVDFIDMEDEKNVRRLEQHFVSLLKKDRARVRYNPISQFGLMEISRQRLSRSIEESNSVKCERCKGTGRRQRDESFALRLLRKLRGSASQPNICALIVQAPAAAATYLLNEKRSEIRRLEDESDCEILIAPNDAMFPPDYKVRALKGGSRITASFESLEKKNENADEQLHGRLTAKQNNEVKKPLLKNVMPLENAPTAAKPAAKTTPNSATETAEKTGFWESLKQFLGLSPADKKPAPPDKHRPRRADKGRGDRDRDRDHRRNGEGQKRNPRHRHAKNGRPESQQNAAPENRNKRRKNRQRPAKESAMDSASTDARPDNLAQATDNRESQMDAARRQNRETKQSEKTMTEKPSTEKPAAEKPSTSVTKPAAEKSAAESASEKTAPPTAKAADSSAAKPASPAATKPPDIARHDNASSQWQIVETAAPEKTRRAAQAKEVTLPDTGAAKTPNGARDAGKMQQVETA